MAAWSAQGYIYNKAGTALVGITVNAYRIDTGALVGTTATVGASAGPPPKGAGYWIIAGLDTTLEYRIEAIFSASQKVVRTRFNAEMGTLTVFDNIYLPVDTAIFVNGVAFNTVYAKLASPAFTGVVTMAANGLNVGSGQLQVTGGNVSLSGTLAAIGATLTGDLTVRSDGAVSSITQRNSTDATPPVRSFLKSRGTNGSPTIVAASDVLGSIDFRGYDGGAYRGAATIQAFVDGTPGASDMPGGLIFFTTPDGSTTLTERLRINAAGQLCIGAGISGPQIRLQSETGTGITLGGSNNIEFLTSGNLQIRMVGTSMGFYGSSGTAKPTITGSRGANAALASLLTALAAMGLLTDSSTA